MRFAPETLVVFLATSVAVGAPPVLSQAPAPAPPGASPLPSPSPSPTPRYKFVPYGFEGARDKTVVPLLRFEDKAEVRSLEMNAAIARFFDHGDEKGNMLRGATPGGAPTLREMAPYRPHVTPGMNLLSAAEIAVKEIKKQIDQRRGLPPPDPSPTPSPSLRP